MIFTAGMINTPTWARIPWTGRERSIHTRTHTHLSRPKADVIRAVDYSII